MTTRKHTRRHRKQTALKPVVLPLQAAEATAHSLPQPGPGVKVRVPLNALPAYLSLYHLVPMTEPSTDPVDGRRPILRVRRTIPRESAQDLWHCQACPGEPEYIHADMMVHLREVHQIDPPKALGTKEMTSHIDGKGFTRSTFLYTINNLRFERIAVRTK